MEELDLDNWFFCLPACQQMDITGIYFNEDTATDETYEQFDNAVADWWDELGCEDKRYIYERGGTLNPANTFATPAPVWHGTCNSITKTH